VKVSAAPEALSVAQLLSAAPAPSTAQAQRDTFWQGRLTVFQPARGCGYRFNLDPVLLAQFAEPAQHVLELGAGCGILSLLLLASGRAARVTAVEVQPELAELCQRNAAANGLDQHLQVLRGDLRHTALPQADAVVFNPPYFAAHTGKASPQWGRDAARHERHGTLSDFVKAAAAAVVPGGPVAAIVPAGRSEELQGLFAAAQLAQVCQQDVCAREGQSPGHVLMVARQGPATFTQRPALVIHTGVGRDFTAGVAAWIEGPAQWKPPKPTVRPACASPPRTP
jgi:tRNA1Val (adenine37-N6)-methyltransferase